MRAHATVIEPLPPKESPCHSRRLVRPRPSGLRSGVKGQSPLWVAALGWAAGCGGAGSRGRAPVGGCFARPSGREVRGQGAEPLPKNFLGDGSNLRRENGP